ncbi:hypothetical protein B0H17DRAFT_1200918 [Mycena rosella]|uniref:Uncharacterized protein n=1 Tax=Mycena rosella TaxID=1033263 RepID=A0AAD7GI03_MYCRO|nr:hypothetical protein B0H17DRAFT_1200918 [Mycena rosella]
MLGVVAQNAGRSSALASPKPNIRERERGQRQEGSENKTRSRWEDNGQKGRRPSTGRRQEGEEEEEEEDKGCGADNPEDQYLDPELDSRMFKTERMRRHTMDAEAGIHPRAPLADDRVRVGCLVRRRPLLATVRPTASRWWTIRDGAVGTLALDRAGGPQGRWRLEVRAYEAGGGSKPGARDIARAGGRGRRKLEAERADGAGRGSRCGTQKWAWAGAGACNGTEERSDAQECS